jgi:hypothetical protein
LAVLHMYHCDSRGRQRALVGHAGSHDPRASHLRMQARAARKRWLHSAMATRYKDVLWRSRDPSKCDRRHLTYTCCLCSKMPMRQRSRLVPTQLPPCDGPKLHRFKYHNFHIKWHERLGNDQDDDSSADGYVFRAEINHREYAIKVVSSLHPTSFLPLPGREKKKKNLK